MKAGWRWRSAALVRVCLLVVSVLYTGCAGLQSALHPAGPQATHISHLWWLMLWVCTGIFVLVMGFLLYAVFRPRQQNQTAIVPATERRTARAVVAAVVITGLVLCVFLVADFWTDRALAALSTSQPLKIKVTGHQWWWGVEYEATVPSQMVTTGRTTMGSSASSVRRPSIRNMKYSAKMAPATVLVRYIMAGPTAWRTALRSFVSLAMTSPVRVRAK